jgi:uncharacterized membrane protein
MKLFDSLLKYPIDQLAGGKLVFLSRIPGELLALIFLAFVVAVWLMYRQASGKLARKQRLVLVTMRGLFFLVLFAVLAVPAIRLMAAPKMNSVYTVVMLDTSRSMSISDVKTGGKETTRLSAALDVVNSKPDSKGIVEKLKDISDVYLFTFDRSANRVADFNPDKLKADGQFTNVFKSMRDMDTEMRGMPVASVVMLTDGCSNSGGTMDDAATILKNKGVPLHVIGLGNPNPENDFEVSRIFAPSTVRRNSEVEIYATVRHTGFKEPFEIIIRRDKTELKREKYTPAGSGDLERVKLSFTPDIEGASVYTVEIPAAKAEKITSNNASTFNMKVEDKRLPVLYIEGSPRLEYRFLRRAMFRDNDFRLVGLLRLSEKRFLVQGANDQENYLQEEGFPTTKERLFAFQAIILGDIEAAHFSAEQLAMLEEFVKVRGGGVLMLGGVNSFGLGKYAGTPVGKMLPFAIADNDPVYLDDKYTARVTDEALDHPVMRLWADKARNKVTWEQAPKLIGITPVGAMKAGATLLLANEKGDRPVLAVQNYGAGRVGAFTSGGSWYWQMSMPVSDSFHEKFWKQFIRWLVLGAKEQLTVETDSEVYARKEPVTIRATVLGRDLTAINDANVVARVKDPLNNVQPVQLEWILSQDGTYAGRFIPEEEGNYTIEVSVDKKDVKISPVTIGLQVSEPLIEFSNSGLKEAALGNMAKIATGKYYSLADAATVPDEIASQLKASRFADPRAEDKEIWDMPLLFGLLVTLGCIEWFYRRRVGLA